MERIVSPVFSKTLALGANEVMPSYGILYVNAFDSESSSIFNPWRRMFMIAALLFWACVIVW